MIKFKNVSKSYTSKTHALKNISMNIQKGEFVFIVGTSGAGKSTFLKLISCEEKPTEGDIIVDGQTITKLKRRKVPYLRRKMGIVFQDFRLISKMTVYENVAFAMRVIGKTNKQIKKDVPAVLELVGLKHKKKSKVYELSGGEQQRVSLARAIINNPKILIADEPTSNIDPLMSHEILDLLMEINATGTTVIVVTHEHELISHYNKRVIEINRGQVVMDTSNSENFDASEATYPSNIETSIDIEEQQDIDEDDENENLPDIEDKVTLILNARKNGTNKEKEIKETANK